MRKLFILLTLIFLSLPIFAHEGSMAGAGKLRVSQTKYFDIIYGEKNLEAAKILYENADTVYEELADAYNLEYYFRLPVVITTSVEQFNAYYADSPYNRIVLYDTAQIEDLSVFSQTLLLTFTHELTHAVTYNHKNKGFVWASKLFGDVISGHYITVTNGMAEGATVSYESSKGEGRLNDAYALQMIRQAKIEGKFPSYSDVKGASDAYPRNSFYYFNGAFADYLQKNYGMDKYAELWYRCVNAKNITVAGAFKKIYDFKLNQAWKQFEQDFWVPQVSAVNPVEAGQAKDFFEALGNDHSIKNKAGSLYSNLCVSKTKIAYIDKSNNTIYVVQNGKKPKKLFHQDYLDSIELSADGRFLAIGYYSTASATIRHCAKIYAFERKRTIQIPGTNYVSPAVISADASYYFVAQKYEAQRYSIVVEKLNAQNKISPDENPVVYTFDEEQVPGDFIDLGNGRFAFTLKSKLDFSICTSDVKLSDITEYSAPVEKMKIRGLSFANDSILFSWATKETLPRLGKLDLSTGSFSLMQEDISGGVYSPVEFEGHIYYSAQFFKQSRLLELVDANQESAQTNTTTPESLSLACPELVEGKGQPIIPYKSFSPLKYAFDGILLPVGGLPSNNMNLGLTYITSLPWYASVTMFSGGYDFYSETGLFDFAYQSGTDTSLCQYSLASSLLVDNQGFKKLNGSGYISSGFDFGKRNAVLFTAQAAANYGRLYSDSDSQAFDSVQLGSVSWSNVITTGPGTYEHSGITLTAGIAHSYEKHLESNAENPIDIYDLEIDSSIYIPKLLPILCIDNFTYNLPVKVKTSIFNLSDSEYRLASINADALLFGYDIQKAVPGFGALFLNDIILTINYIGGIDYETSADYSTNWHIAHTSEYIDQIKTGKLNYQDYATIKLTLGFTPNIGAFANSNFRYNLYLSYAFGKSQNLPEKLFNVGFEGKF